MAQEEKITSKIEVKKPKKAIVLVAETTKAKPRRFELDLTKKSPLIQDIRDRLDYYVIGQDKAKDEIINALSRTLIDDDSRTRPIANMMFLGPTGVGKTQVARALFWILFGDENINLGQCKIDANNFKDSSDLSNLIGASPKYVGRSQIPILSEKVIFKAYEKAKKEGTLHPILDNYSEFSILLIDEVEKACPDFHDLFLSIMDEGVLELSNGAEEGIIKEESEVDYHKTTHFKNVLIIFTSNVGAEDIQDKLKGKGSMGFKTESSDGVDTILSTEYYKNLVKKSSVFKPEFLGRLDSFVPFQSLTKDEFYKRLALSIDMHNKKYAKTSSVKLLLTSGTKKHIVEKSINSGEGARKLVKIFDKDIKTIYTRSVFNNSEIDRVEEMSGQKVKYIEIDYVDEKYIGYALIDENQKALRREQKIAAKLIKKQEALNDQEVIISLQDGSYLKTLTSIIIPNLQYYRALVSQKESLFHSDEDIVRLKSEILLEKYTKELKKTKLILDAFGIQTKDYQMIESDVLEENYYKFAEFFDNIDSGIANVKMWNDSDGKKSFSGMFNIIKEHIEGEFSKDNNPEESEKGLNYKQMINGGAGSMHELLQPFIDFTEKLIDREITEKERSLIVEIFHKEYIKLNGEAIIVKSLPNPDKNKKKEGGKEKKTKKEVKKEPKNDVTININFYGSDNQTDWKTRLKNLFTDDFDKVFIAIKQNMPSAGDSNDIIDILGAIKIELVGKLGLNLTNVQSMELHDIVKMLLKEDDIISGLDDKPEKD